MNEESGKKIIQNKTCVQNKRNTKRRANRNFFFRFCFITKKPTIYVERLHKKKEKKQKNQL
jgi:hypothetical protein